jgi:methionyl-tRNA formyltransferase
MSKGAFDRGQILHQTRLQLPPEVDYLTLEGLLARQGGEALLEVLQDFDQTKVSESYSTVARSNTPQSASSETAARSL